jgi:pimeloyl-ACP methyl ester carboxylesterase
MAEAIEKQTAPNSPNILILDWSLAAKPSKAEGANIQGDPIARLYDIGAIRSQAYRLGDLAAVKLKDWIIEDKIDKNAPLYLIGHSAGGFAVARCALTLKKYGTTPRQIHITILDTPVELPLPLIGDITDRELLKELPAQFPGAVDFYASSSAVRLPKDFNVPGLHFEWLDHNSEGLVKDHSYAYQWYIDTIGKPEKSEGFWISRLFKRK